MKNPEKAVHEEIVLCFGAFYAALAVVFGAFGAHALKKIFTVDLQKSFETGIKYQMYHALALLLIGFSMDFDNAMIKGVAYSFIFGILFFSFSIYGLCITSARGRKWKFLGPITPLGGLMFVVGWGLLFFSFLHS